MAEKLNDQWSLEGPAICGIVIVVVACVCVFVYTGSYPPPRILTVASAAVRRQQLTINLKTWNRQGTSGRPEDYYINCRYKQANSRSTDEIGVSLAACYTSSSCCLTSCRSPLLLLLLLARDATRAFLGTERPSHDNVFDFDYPSIDCAPLESSKNTVRTGRVPI